ncbi:membrane protease subunit, stomatin/prohibitin [Mycobacterium sp. CVI_P3]|uniref:Membrane protease subunit, stomatin/prohibitin n=1 Tax=Mycobacterium pinniadriaticum TaxID=2994102 RepID=A0ABT3SHV4_9MYCO|nr:membrane protease subunit, stomatin/prohibitin [Mycobacterium pinniadriaticum]MCX2932683.1 membrane protease subunit, stomatin/prohibitin [Mycobacterium pinniadriaticum]MCX2939107.1 membrane protease subunit, stomatin/prohibitin [Mycobacterium pinniadriaticum]
MKSRIIAIGGVVAVLVVGGIVLSGCSTQVGAGTTAVKVDDYFMIPTDPKVEGCINPETSEFNPPGGFTAYLYPSRQISWDALDAPDAEAPATIVVSNASAPAELKVPVSVTFDLTTDCQRLMNFHRDFGTKYQGWLNSDGTVSQGWKNLLRYVVGQPLQNTLVSVAQKYTWRQIWNDEKVRIEFQNALRDNLPQATRNRTNGEEYFTNFQVTVMKPDPVDPNLKAAITAEQQAIADANAVKAKGIADAEAAKAKADADVTAARAQTELAHQQALQKQAEIAGYPSVDDYLKAKAIEAGQNPYQPTYVVPQAG